MNHHPRLLVNFRAPKWLGSFFAQLSDGDFRVKSRAELNLCTALRHLEETGLGHARELGQVFRPREPAICWGRVPESCSGEGAPALIRLPLPGTHFDPRPMLGVPIWGPNFDPSPGAG